MGGDIDRTQLGAALRVQRPQVFSRRKPDLAAVIGDAADVARALEGSVFPDDLCL